MQQTVIKLGKAVQTEPRLNRCEVCQLRHVEENVRARIKMSHEGLFVIALLWLNWTSGLQTRDGDS